MFTGLVEEMGTVRQLLNDPEGTRLSIASTVAREGLALGDSVCVDGACLTVTELDSDGFWIGLSPETLQRTNLGERQVGDRVNLERSLQVGGRLGGHYVQGHVDGVGQVVETRPDGDSLRVWFTAPDDLMPYIVRKGYICLDGVSLTITEKVDGRFGVALVAYTQSKITLPNKAVGSTVNIEVDVFAKYVESLLEGRVERDGSRSWTGGPEVNGSEPDATFCSIPEAIDEFRKGRMVLIVDDEDRENEGDIAIAAQFATPEVINFMAYHGRGLVCMPMLQERLDQLEIPLMVARNSLSMETAFTVSVDARKGVTTGISAHDRYLTVQALIDPNSTPNDIVRPGHLFPLRYTEGGVLRRAGHTEASVDLAKLAHLYPAAVICEVMNADGTMARMPDLLQFAKEHSIKIFTVAQLVEYRRRTENLVQRVADAEVPTEFGTFTCIAFESVVTKQHHLALVRGDLTGDPPPLVRMHSECLTGDVFGSQRCDCGDQLKRSLQMIGEEGRGVVVYMRHHEGRGIGIVNKLRAYRLQEEEGMDTVEANLHLGFPPDPRDYGIGAQILVDLGIKQLRLLTNNPSKRAGIQGFGLEVVDRVPLVSSPNDANRRYLETKQAKMGHMLDLDVAAEKPADGTRQPVSVEE